MLEFAVIPGDTGGFRLVVNEWPYRGSVFAGEFIGGVQAGEDGQTHPVFGAVSIGANSFVLADRLAYCKLMYLEHIPVNHAWVWRADWPLRKWPSAIRIEMVPMDANGAKLHPMTVTAEVHAVKQMEMQYSDQSQ